jgi:hypothetical protein
VNREFRRVALIAASLGLILSLFFALRDDDGRQDAAATTAVTTVPTTSPPPVATTEPPAGTTTEPPPPATTAPPARVTIRIRIVGGRPAGGIRRAQVRQGRDVAIVVTADVTDHVHLHGYDLMADVAPGSRGRIAFTATIPGRFEIELEDRGVQIAELEVRP